MGHVFTVVAPGMMGSAVAARLHERGATVRTTLSGRSAASAARAAAAGMTDVARDADLVEGVDIILSIVPPGDAVGLAERFAPLLAAVQRKPLYVDCNAVSPVTATAIAEVIVPTGAELVDGGIIGGPPKAGYGGPNVYVSGAAAPEARLLRDYGLEIRVLDGPVGAASALKLSYAGLTKGLTALGTAMFLGAAASGSDGALIAELGESQKEMLAWLRRQIPGSYDKAYRWVAEMQEISEFLEPNDGAAQIYAGAAQLYEFIAAANAAPRSPENAVAVLDSVLAKT
jgi:3-hydroxyisobutyrate dehydrogenase-like beta-hydroxyacid dehydrogenase